MERTHGALQIAHATCSRRAPSRRCRPKSPPRRAEVPSCNRPPQAPDLSPRQVNICHHRDLRSKLNNKFLGGVGGTAICRDMIQQGSHAFHGGRRRPAQRILVDTRRAMRAFQSLFLSLSPLPATTKTQLRAQVRWHRATLRRCTWPEKMSNVLDVVTQPRTCSSSRNPKRNATNCCNRWIIKDNKELGGEVGVKHKRDHEVQVEPSRLPSSSSRSPCKSLTS